MALTLVVLAAGIGSRYGGLKQIDPVGSDGELIIDYSLFDAVRAGFDRFVFVVRPDIASDFREVIGGRIEQRFACAYVQQQLHTALPAGCRLPPDRVKPLGTAHAVLACADAVKEPFAVINADDFYGADAYRQLAGFLRAQRLDGNDYAMVAYRLGKTLSEHGTVARGICAVSEDGWLQNIVEQTAIEATAGGARARDDDGAWRPLDRNGLVSMNCWGFTPSLFRHLADRFPAFLESLAQRPKAEFFLPSVVDELLQRDECRVRVLRSEAQWFGVTYPADKAIVQQRVLSLVSEGLYPAPLWG